MWPARDETRPMSLDVHGKRFKQIFEAAGIIIDKATHAPRVFGARLGDEAGLDDAVRTLHVLCNFPELFYVLLLSLSQLIVAQ